MTVDGPLDLSARRKLLMALGIAGILGGSALAFGFQLMLSALPDVAWAGTGLWKTITPQFVPTPGLWALTVFAGGLPAAFISFLLVSKTCLLSPKSFVASLSGPWAVALPAVLVFRLGDGFLLTGGASWVVAIELAATSAVVGSITFVLGLLLARRRNLTQ